ncbi:AMP-binding protein [Thiohalobacter sp.]|uniref:AMP-binding protein n=1 Tax=Thiohalobacter sp. TaxID=2025948 RepID=UPI00263A2412|nr:AMP-binding protein [Thiohalobacter sp.]
MNETASHQAVLDILRDLLAELHGDRIPPDVTLASHLEQDLGIDSLGRVELLMRIRTQLGLDVAEDEIFEVVTVGDLLSRLGVAADTRAETPLPTPTAAPDGQVRWPAQAESLNAVLAFHAERLGDRPYLTFLAGSGVQTLTHAQLFERAGRAAAALRAHGVEPGDRVALMLPSGFEFFDAFYGTLCAGAVPVPLYPPASKARIEAFLLRQAGILDNAGTRVFVTSEQIRPFAHALRQQVAALEHILPASVLTRERGHVCLPRKADDLAFLQYTSGSTGQPKGVMLTHGNLLANVRAMGQAARVDPGEDLFVSWLPLYHDMGLIGACLGSLYHALPLVLMSPLSFISRPQRWLQALHDYRGTLSAAPNFAYQLCASRLEDSDIEGLDLSRWRLAFNGAEPVHAQTIERFCSRMQRAGFRREAMTPVYGLAENAVGLCFPPPGRGPRYDTVDRQRLVSEGIAEPVEARAEDATEIVGCGLALPDHEIRVVDAQRRPLPDRRVGEIQFRGPSATQGYFRNPEATAALVDGEWRNTGDRGYLVEGEIFLTGRIKEIIFRAGRNLYPYELEQAIGDLEGIRKGGVAVFAAMPPQGGEERLVVVAETRERSTERRKALVEHIRELSMTLLDTAPDDILLTPPRTVPKTSSGKIQRAECARRYREGRLLPDGRGGGSLRVRLALGVLLAAGRRGLRRGGRLLYAGWAWLAAIAVALPSLLLVLLAPGRRTAQRVAHVGARALLWLAGLPLRVEGENRLPAGRPLVLVANHASYLDALVLIAALDHPLHFVAKRELANHPLLRAFLRRLGTEFVTRSDVRASVAETEALVARVAAGDAVVFFPEGTFTEASGLRPFRLGAFRIAADTGTPVVAVALRGTREVLRGDRWLPRHGRLEVIVGKPLEPAGNDWAAAIALRDAARRFILEHTGEPDLAGSASIALPAGTSDP